MKRHFLPLTLLLCVLLMGCGAGAGTKADEPAGNPIVGTPISSGEESTPSAQTADSNAGASTDDTAAETSPEATSEAESTSLTPDEALVAIQNYCIAGNPELASIVEAGEYPTYWEVVDSSEEEIVVLYRSYTGAQVRYYINPVSGDTYVTEFVPGITDEEQRTDETFSARDYLE